MKLRQIKTLVATHPNILDANVNEFIRRNPYTEIIQQTFYATSNMLFCSIVALVDVEPILEEVEELKPYGNV